MGSIKFAIPEKLSTEWEEKITTNTYNYQQQSARNSESTTSRYESTSIISLEAQGPGVVLYLSQFRKHKGDMIRLGKSTRNGVFAH